jgi:hypothetical protein
MTIRSTSLIINGIAVISAILFNSFLVFLIIRYTSSEMKEYSRLLLIHCVVDVFYDIVQFSVGGVSCFKLSKSKSLFYLDFCYHWRAKLYSATRTL